MNKPRNRIEYMKRYRQEHRERCYEVRRIYVAKNYERLNAIRIEKQKRDKLEVLNHYTNDNIYCQCPSGECKETAIEFMTIDHINGGGTKHRKATGGGGIAFYRWLKRNNYPSGYRVLCFNCNCSLGFHKYCPHSL